jgi:uncharacterized integral membrane protein (TIGR00697 family)
LHRRAGLLRFFSSRVRPLAEGKETNMNTSFRYIFGQGLWIIVGSIVAFLVGQFSDVYVFQWIKKRTKSRFLWLRATGSTLVSQLVDSYIVLLIAFYIGAGFPLKTVLAIGAVNYAYKFVVAVILTPLLYILHGWIDRFLGKELLEKMQREAAE